ncbi:MAG: FdhF/YdeP family oxidoreductase, partial [Cyclobacteriaceae bacterium]|nr:FdhF/YdeP family oxidoreductase [Cyclobacteriaceae bacterium]
IDCPGCAWPDPAKRSKLGEFCENGVKAIAEEAMSRKAGVSFFEQYSIDQLKAESDYWLGQQGRLTQPMVLEAGNSHYQPISWAEAFSLIGKELKSLQSPQEAIFYTSGRTSNEAAFLYQLFVRMYGTNNLPDCSNMCHEASGVALKETVGIGKGSVTLEDFDQAEIIMVLGQNPGTNHPRMLSSLEKAKKNGARIIVVNPLKEVGLINFTNPQTVKGIMGIGTPLADLYLQIRINEDVALLKAVMIKLLERAKQKPGILDQDFIRAKTSGFDDLYNDLKQYDVDQLIRRTGLPPDDVEKLIDWLSGSKKIIVCWAMGLTQHENGVDNIRELVNLLLLKGSIGKPGAGTCPVRGHSNVQGDRTMGIHERPSKGMMDKLASELDITPPKEHGYNVVSAIQAMHERKARVFIALGGNFLSAAPDTYYTAEALQKCDLTVHVSTKLNRSHLTPGKTALILPTLGRTDKHVEQGKEQAVTVENSMGVVHFSRGLLEPPSEQLLSEPAIVAGMAKAALENTNGVDWESLVSDYGNIRDLIEKIIPGFERYNQKLREDHGFALPNGAREGKFDTDHQKAVFTINRLSDIIPEKDELLLMTIRSHDQFNTTIYDLNDRYRGIKNGRMVVFMNEKDMDERDLKSGDRVNLLNHYNITREVKGFTVVPYSIPKGCIAAYFPEANVLIPLNQHGKESGTPAYKSVKVRLEK